MAWTEQRIRTFEQFFVELRGVVPTPTDPDTEYWFRGQSSAAWPLTPSFLRKSAHLPIDRAAAARLELEALKAFQWQAHLFIKSDLLQRVRTRACWWALMQHHRAPTRLLDWTISPFVAAYFAAQPSEDSSHGAVWCFCSRKLRHSFEAQHGDIPSFESDEAPKWYVTMLDRLSATRSVLPLAFHQATSDRMVAQQCRFTMGFVLGERHDCIAESVGATHARKLVIEHDSKREFLMRLREMNITASTLFPGVDGLGQSIGELIAMGGDPAANDPCTLGGTPDAMLSNLALHPTGATRS